MTLRTGCFEGNVSLLLVPCHCRSPVMWGVDPATDYPFFRATLCLDEAPSRGCVWLQGWDENDGLPEALETAGVVELTGRTQPVGNHWAQEARLL